MNLWGKQQGRVKRQELKMPSAKNKTKQYNKVTSCKVIVKEKGGVV